MLMRGPSGKLGDEAEHLQPEDPRDTPKPNSWTTRDGMERLKDDLTWGPRSSGLRLQ